MAPQPRPAARSSTEAEPAAPAHAAPCQAEAGGRAARWSCRQTPARQTRAEAAAPAPEGCESAAAAGPAARAAGPPPVLGGGHLRPRPAARRCAAPPAQARAPRACRPWRAADLRLGRALGAGLAGSVRVATLRGGRQAAPFAVKVMEKGELVRRKMAPHVLRERRILSAVGHPFIVELVASFQDETRLFMLMELVSGGELKTRMEQAGKLPDASARFYASELTLGLGYLHKAAIVHRDLKPENVLIDGCGHLKIADFGMAKVVHHLTWTLCGTPHYLAPEFITGRGHGRAADWWALGVLTYEMLAGTHPFTGRNVRRLYRKVVEEAVAFPGDMTGDARSLIGGLLTKEQSHRLGGSAADAEDVMGHSWFGPVDWGRLLRKQCEPPFVPRARPPRGIRALARGGAPEESPRRGCPASEEQQALFRDFDSRAGAAPLSLPRRRAPRSFWGRVCASIARRGA